MLNITDKTTDPRVMFVELGPGDLFKFDHICMKIFEVQSADPALKFYNAVDLESHHLLYISPVTKVTTINAELTVYDKKEEY